MDSASDYSVAWWGRGGETKTIIALRGGGVWVDFPRATSTYLGSQQGWSVLGELLLQGVVSAESF
ncbi:hypothetical protein LINPERHAP1_LOCUS35752, partial [Linum perenne]